MIRELTRELVGFTNYEKRMMEMIRIGTGAANKKALALVKKRLGSIKRARAKREELETLMQSMRHKDEPKEEPKEEHHKVEAKKEEEKPAK